MLTASLGGVESEHGKGPHSSSYTGRPSRGAEEDQRTTSRLLFGTFIVLDDRASGERVRGTPQRRQARRPVAGSLTRSLRHPSSLALKWASTQAMVTLLARGQQQRKHL